MIVQTCDKNKNGVIDRSEFIDMLKPKLQEDYAHAHENIADVKRMFKQADVDHSGFLNANELKNAMLKHNVILSDAELADLMKEMDSDANGTIDINEFI